MFAATTGQVSGLGVGQLPPGYLPLTATDGLGALSAYTLEAATAVRTQDGKVPSVIPSGSTTTSTTGASTPVATSGSSAAGAGNSSGVNSATSYAGTGSFAPRTTANSPQSPTSKTLPSSPTAEATKEAVPVYIRLDRTADVTLWTSGFPLALTVTLALVGMLGAFAVLRLGRRRGQW